MPFNLKNSVALPVRALTWIGGQSTRAVAALVFIGIAVPPLGELVKPFVTEAIFLLLCISFMRVDLAALSPELIDRDEDMVGERFPELVAEQPPRREMTGDLEAPGQAGALARWADETAGFDRSEVTARSLECKRIAYRGVIPPVALTLPDTPVTCTCLVQEA